MKDAALFFLLSMCSLVLSVSCITAGAGNMKCGRPFIVPAALCIAAGALYMKRAVVHYRPQQVPVSGSGP